ncbi:hypothetical protein K443DRAFT_114998, partial [Laccaria amethystina LaAM-08-1]
NFGFCTLKLNPRDIRCFKTNTNSFTMHMVKLFAHVEGLVIYFGRDKNFYVALPLLAQMTQFFCGIHSLFIGLF